MKDFKILTAKILLKINTVVPVRNFLPPAIMVTGEDLNKLDQIYYNEVLAEDYIITSSSRLVVAVPESQIGKDLFSLKIISTVPVPFKDADLTLELGGPLRSISGIERLIQSWLLIFMTNPGSDIFSPDSGGGGRSIIGKPTDSLHKSVSADLTLAIERAKSELLRLQSKYPRVPPSEKLLSASLENIAFNQSTGILSARVSITNMIGQSGEVSVG
jgi:hypothetical protein